MHTLIRVQVVYFRVLDKEVGDSKRMIVNIALNEAKKSYDVCNVCNV
jgi:hypothetical protein